MSTNTLPLPSELRRELAAKLPPMYGRLTVTPRDKAGRKCPAMRAAWYEVAAWYAEMGTSLDDLEEALRAWPGCVRTTRVGAYGKVRDEDWPGFARRYNPSWNPLRPQVLALIADPPQDGSGQEAGR